jgi:ubiquinone/menaquinone biosynthesis C-methylase UbiE
VDNCEFSHFTFSKKCHFNFFCSSNYDRQLYQEKIDPFSCVLKRYQDLLVFSFITHNIPQGSKILDVGGGNSRILRYFRYEYESWNIDKLEGCGNGPKKINTSGYRLVRDYMGNFSPELADNYFDFVFSISALEHVSQDDPELFERILEDINRVLKPGGYSLHCFDIVMHEDYVWTNKLLPFLFARVKTLNEFVPFENLRSEPDLWVMLEEPYKKFWQPKTKKNYDDFGKPLSYNILWRKRKHTISKQGT